MPRELVPSPDTPTPLFQGLTSGPVELVMLLHEEISVSVSLAPRGLRLLDVGGQLFPSHAQQKVSYVPLLDPLLTNTLTIVHSIHQAL